MKKYSDRERLDILSDAFNDCLSIRDNTVFTITTQHFDAKNMRDAADYMIHYRKFLEAYGYDKTTIVGYHFNNTYLIKKRRKVWFEENRKLTKKEEAIEIKKDERYKKEVEKLNEKFAQQYAEDMFNAMFELNEEKKEIKIRKWNNK